MKPIKVKIDTEIRLHRVWGAVLFAILISLNVAWGIYLETDIVFIIAAGVVWCLIWGFLLGYATGLISDK